MIKTLMPVLLLASMTAMADESSRGILVRISADSGDAAGCELCNKVERETYSTDAWRKFADDYEVINLAVDNGKSLTPNMTAQDREKWLHHVKNNPLKTLIQSGKLTVLPAVIVLDPNGKTIKAILKPDEIASFKTTIPESIKTKPTNLYDLLTSSKAFEHDDIEMALAYTAQPTIIEDEDRGIFHDDKYPLLLARTKAVAAPKVCEAPENQAAFSEGYLQSVSGQRFAIMFSVPIWQEDGSKHSVERPDRKACNTFRDQPDKNQQLECCMAGFQRGVPALLDYITGTADPNDPAAKRCRADFKTGQSKARGLCNLQASRSERCMPSPMSIRYLNCFHLGFMTEYGACSKEAQTFLKITLPSISNQNNPKAPDEPSSTTGARNAGSVK